MWLPAIFLLCAGLILYKLSHHHFTLAQLGGLPEILPRRQHQRLVTTGIRSHVRHPVYLGHLCEMLAWSIGTGLIVCWTLTAFAILTGAVMIAMEDRELGIRFGEQFRAYRLKVPAIVLRIFS
jgi:protein-S-isoprenylcysteine O-methyltransferase Ste14